MTPSSARIYPPIFTVSLRHKCRAYALTKVAKTFSLLPRFRYARVHDLGSISPRCGASDQDMAAPVQAGDHVLPRHVPLERAIVGEYGRIQ